MKIQSTKIIEGDGKVSVEMLIADTADPLLSSQSLVIRVDVPTRQSNLRLAVIQKVALQNVQDLVTEQIAATESALGNT